jgi:ABC-2 type transport system permease protein
LPWRDTETATERMAGRPLTALLGKELRELFCGRALWFALLIMCPLTGFSFIQAAELYGEASRAAANEPALARGLSPLDGVLVPTFGALYVATTFLFPFVAIRLLGREKETGALALLLQLPYRPSTVVAAKVALIAVAWALLASPALSALVLWRALGGHLGPAETANLLLGHGLYGLLVGSSALLAAALTESTATAAIAALSITIGTWILDFAGGFGVAGWLGGLLVRLSPIQALRGFERGLFSLKNLIGLALAALGCAALSAIWLPPGVVLRTKLVRSGVLLLAVGVSALVAAPWLRVYADAAEDRRNSFSLADERALRRLTGVLAVTVHLAPEDPRYADLRRRLLDKLDRTLPAGTRTRLAVTGGRFLAGGAAADGLYGEVVYAYGDREASSPSTSSQEILPLVYQLAGVTPPSGPAADRDYPGYPLVAANLRPIAIWFYVVLPCATVVVWLWQSRRRPTLHWMTTHEE